MTCDKDGNEMIKMGSKLTSDHQQLLTCYLCPLCYARKIERQHNPRYMPMLRESDTKNRTPTLVPKSHEP